MSLYCGQWEAQTRLAPQVGSSGNGIGLTKVPQTHLCPVLYSTQAISITMRLLNHIRSRSRLKNGEPQAQAYDYGHADSQPAYRSRIASHNPTAQLPRKIFEEIFAAVCPHSRDETYLSSEDSMLDGGCMLCDLRDLSHCAMVNRQWAGPALAML